MLNPQPLACEDGRSPHYPVLSFSLSPYTPLCFPKPWAPCKGFRKALWSSIVLGFHGALRLSKVTLPSVDDGRFAAFWSANCFLLNKQIVMHIFSIFSESFFFIFSSFFSRIYVNGALFFVNTYSNRRILHNQLGPATSMWKEEIVTKMK